MNKRQKIVQGRFLDNEEAVIGMLEDTYRKSLEDVTKKAQKLYDEIETLKAELDFIEDEEERRIQQSKIQSKVYQKQYQDGLKKQLDDVLDKMHKENFTTVSDYLQTCYEDGFVGTLYDLQGQGIPLAFPIDQESVTRAVQIDSKISNGLYSHMGEDVAGLKKHIASEISRGISSGMTFNQIAQLLSFKMVGTYNNSGGSLAYAKRIARTEGHRIQCQAGMDACYKAKDMGADVVKQWDSTLDAKTRESHVKVDQEVKEIDEPFSNGLMFPGDPSGGAAEVVNCRCALLERARWAVKGGFTKRNNFTKQLESFESPEEYAEFKQAFFSKENRNYMRYTEQMREKYDTKDLQKLLEKMDDREYNHFMKLQKGNPMFNKAARTGKTLTNTANSGKIPLKNIADATDFDSLEDYFDTTYGIKMDASVKALDFGCVHKAMTGIEDTVAEFPEVAQRLKTIKTSKSGVMACSGEEITFNPTYFADSSKIEGLCKQYDGGWWVRNANPASIGAHETAHGIEWELLQLNSAYMHDWQRIDAWNKCSEAKAIVSQACKNVKKTPYGKGKKNAELIGSISRYAHDTPSETMAEAFADVYANGANASPLSTEIKRLTVEQLKKYKGVT